MLKAPANEAKQHTDEVKTNTPQLLEREQHRRLGTSATPVRAGGPGGGLPLPSVVAPARHQSARLQSMYGNQAVLRMLDRSRPSDGPVTSQFAANRLQAKLAINEPGDVYEQEADRVADEVMRMSEPARPQAPIGQTASPPSLERKCACGGSDTECANCTEEREGALQRAAARSGAPEEAPPIVHEVLRSPGQPLDAATLDFMEARFGRDFGDVRVHTGSREAESARSVSALAYTVGENIVFSRAGYSPRTESGRRLLAHELSHVLQQRSSLAMIQRQPAKPADAEQRAIEVEARACVSKDEQGALETLDSLDMRDLLNVTAKLFDNFKAEKGCAFGTLNADLFLTPPTPETKEATKNVDVPRLRATFDAARVHSLRNPVGDSGTSPTHAAARKSKATKPARPGDWGEDPAGNTWVMHLEGIRTYWTTTVEPKKRSSQWLGKNVGNFGYNPAVSKRAIASFQWGNDYRATYFSESDSEADLRDNMRKSQTVRSYVEGHHLGPGDDPKTYYSNMQKKAKVSPDDPTSAWVDDDKKWKELFEAFRFAEGWIEGKTLTASTIDSASSKAEDAPQVAYYKTLLGVPSAPPTAKPEGEATPVQRTPSAPARHAEAPPIVHEVLRSPGQPLDVSTRAFFERRFGHDFGQVRVHTGTKAAASSRAVQATAYTVGPNIVFADNKYAPTTSAGRRLLAHELTHTIQQEGNGAAGSPFYFGTAHDSSEGGAEEAAAAPTPATITPLTVGLSRDRSQWPAWHQEALASISRIAGPSDGKPADDKIAVMMGFLCTLAKDRAQSLHDRLADTAPGAQTGTDDFAVYVKNKFPKNHDRVISVLQDVADGKSPGDCKVTPAAPPQPQPSAPPATLPPSSRNQEQATRLAVLRQLFSALAAAFATIDAALPTTPAYDAYVKSRQNVMDDTKTALDDADKKLNGATAATDADAIRTDLEQAELWLFFVQYYAQLGALVRSAEHDRLIAGVIVSVASEADAYAKAFTLVKTGTPQALTFARTNAMTQVQNTKRLLDTLKASIAKGQEAVKTAEKVEAVLDVPLKFAAGRAMPVWAVAMTAATQAAGLYAAHTAEFDLITANAGSFLAELKWLNDNAPVTANLVLDPLYVAIGKDALKSVSAADAAFIIGRTMRGLAAAAGKVTVTMVVAVLARCTGIVLFIKSPLLALRGLGKLTEKTKEAALKALGGEADPDHIIRDFNKNFDPPLSAGDVAALLLELQDPARRDHLERLAELGKIMGPAIAVIVSDLKGVGTLTGVTAQAETAAVPLLPPAP